MVTTMNPTAAYTISDFIKAFRIGRTKVYAEISSGRLKAKKAGKRTLILAADADQWAATLAPFVRS